MKEIIKEILLFILDNPIILYLGSVLIFTLISIKMYNKLMRYSKQREEEDKIKISELEKNGKIIFYGTLTILDHSLFRLGDNTFTDYFYETNDAYISINDITFPKSSVERFKKEI